MIEIQKLTSEHVREAALLIVESFKDENVTRTVLDKNAKGVDELYANIMAVFIKMMVESNHHSVVALYDKKIVGVAILTKGQLFKVHVFLKYLPELLSQYKILKMLKLKAAFRIRPLMETLHMEEDFLKLEVLAVSHQYQGQGIARRLIEETEAVAREANLETIYLTTANPENVEIYERLGFTCVEQRNITDFSCFHIIKKVATA